jgi:hypothetical protein
LPGTDIVYVVFVQYEVLDDVFVDWHDSLHKDFEVIIRHVGMYVDTFFY